MLEEYLAQIDRAVRDNNVKIHSLGDKFIKERIRSAFERGCDEKIIGQVVSEIVKHIQLYREEPPSRNVRNWFRSKGCDV